MKVLVTGGSGFIGRLVVGGLVQAGHDVRILTRGTRPVPDGVVSVPGSVLNPASVNKATQSCDAVIHLVGIISEIGDQTYERVHTDGTAAVLAAMRRTGVRRLVHMSALGARADSPARYHRSKAAAESLVRNESALDSTIFRPSLVYGPGDGFVTLFARMARWSPLIPVMGPGTNLLQPVPVASVATAFVRALPQASTIGRTFDLCGPEPLTFREVLRCILKSMNKRRLLISIPWPIAKAQARVLEWVFPKFLHRASPLNRDQLRMLQEDNVGDPNPAETLLGIQPIRFQAGISEFLESRSHPSGHSE